MSIFILVSFLAVNGILFLLAFLFISENEKRFSVALYYTSQKGLGLEMQSLGLFLVLNTRLGLGLGCGLKIKVLVLILVLKKS